MIPNTRLCLRRKFFKIVATILCIATLIHLSTVVSHFTRSRSPQRRQIESIFSNLVIVEDRNILPDTNRRRALDITTDYPQKINELRPGLQLDWWYEICLQDGQQADAVLWHPLYPAIPEGSKTLARTQHQHNTRARLHRLHGYLQPPETGFYNFRLDCEKTCTSVVTLSLDCSKKLPEAKNMRPRFILHRKNEIQDISLKHEFCYYVDMVYHGKNVELKWTLNNTDNFQVIERRFLSHHQPTKRNSDFLLKAMHDRPLYSVDQDERNRLMFPNRLPFGKTDKKGGKILYDDWLPKCKVDLGKPIKINKRYDGYMKNLHNMLFHFSYPREFFQHVEGHVDLDEKDAKRAVQFVFEQLSLGRDLVLVHIVHVQSNFGKKFKRLPVDDTYYFVELDVRLKTSNRVLRTAHFIKPTQKGSFCFMTEYRWKPDVEVNIISPVRNQKPWFIYMVSMLENVLQKTNDRNVNLIVIDYNSTDGNYEEMLSKSKLKYTYYNPILEMSTKNNTGNGSVKFSKVKALNYGLKLVKDKDSIAFIMDMHLQLPLNIFDRIRKLTIQGKTAFTPSLMRLMCGEHEQYTKLKESFWVDNGPGMLAMYKSDFSNIGGYNEKVFKDKWGGEDWEILDRVLAKGYYVIKQRLQRFYHIFHNRHNMW